MKRIFNLLFFIFALSMYAEESEYEKWKKSAGKDVSGWKEERDAELDAYKERVEKERKEWKEYVKNVRGKWGSYQDSEPKLWARYSNDLNSLSMIDFEDNKITLSVISESDKDDKEIKKDLSKNFSDILKEKDGVTGKTVLEGQFEKNGKKIHSENSKEMIADAEVKIDVVIGEDNRPRKTYTVTLKMVPNSIQKRAKRYLSLVKKYSEKYNLDPALVLALMHTESSFNPKAFSRRPDGTPMACGLMQLIPTQAARDAHRALYKKDKIVKPEYLYDPENNIKMGTWYINFLRKWWESREKNGIRKTAVNRK